MAKQQELTRIKKKKKWGGEDVLSTGHTVLNLACTGTPSGGLLKGTYVCFIGDSSSGKTFFAASVLSEACASDRFKDYRLIFDDNEGGMLFDLDYLFHPDLSTRMETIHSEHLDAFYYNLHDAVKEGRPFIYILDSMDGLEPKSEFEAFLENKDAYEKGKASKGSYGMAKAKMNSTNLRRVARMLNESGSILIIISQTRDNVGFGFETKTRSGGRALDFYATLLLWTSRTGDITKTVQGKKRKIGVSTKIKIKKNRQNGQVNEVDASIYYDYGIDDIGACIDYLVDEGAWSKSGRTISSPEFGDHTRDALITLIESDDENIKTLITATENCWNTIQEAMSLNRRSKYEKD